MVDQYDTKFDTRDANAAHTGLDDTVSAGKRFNIEVERGAEIARASDRAKEMINDRTAIFASRMDDQLERENKYRDYGIRNEKTKLLEKQFTSPQPIPDDPKAREVMHREIDEGSVRNYEKRQQGFRDQIDRQYQRDVDEILKMDRESRLPEHGHNHSQEHEHDLDGR